MADHSSDGIILTRRQAVAALGAGVVVAGGAAAISGVAATDAAQQQSDLQLQELNLQLEELSKKNSQVQQQLDAAQRDLAAANLQIQVYQGLLGLYDTLDKIGIDTVVAGALDAYKGTLTALEAGVDTLKAGIVSAENALDNFENGFAAIRAGLTRAQEAWANVNALLGNVQQLIAQATLPVLPLVDQARRFFDDLLSKIPFGAGESARQTINGIIGVLAAIPVALDEFDDTVFQTLRDGWFSDDHARSLEATLAQPIATGVLQPARRFLDQVDTTLNNWQAQVEQPVNAALSQRAIVQQQIAEYRDKNKI